MNGFKFIYFDAGLTLLENNHMELFGRTLSDLGYVKSSREIELAYHLANKKGMRKNLFHSSDGGDEFIRYFLSFLSLPITSEEFGKGYERYREDFRWRAFPFVKGVLEDLKKEGYGLGILSNWDFSLHDILSSEGIDYLFDEMVISCEAGCEKPDEKIFITALEKASVMKSECLFVGDNYYDDVVGSQKAGIRAVLINPDASLGIEEISYPYIIPSVKELPLFLKEEEIL